jgi:hypothetical protein
VAFSQALASRQVGSLLVGRVPSQSEHDAILRYTNAVVVNLSLRRLPRWTLHLRGPRFWQDRRTRMAFARDLVEQQMAATLATLLHHCDLELVEPARAYRHVLRPSLSLGPEFRIRFNGWRRPVSDG